MTTSFGLKKFILIFVCCISVIITFDVRAEDPLPMAPKRYDNRDELPVASFVSLSGADPLLPGEKPNPTAVAAQPPAAGKPRAPATSKKMPPSKAKAKLVQKKVKPASRLPAKVPSKLPAKKTK